MVTRALEYKGYEIYLTVVFTGVYKVYGRTSVEKATPYSGDHPPTVTSDKEALPDCIESVISRCKQEIDNNAAGLSEIEAIVDRTLGKHE